MVTTTEYKPRKRNKVLGVCPLCLRYTILVKHHWFTDNSRTIGFIRTICHTCNAILKTANGDNNHVFPDWETQVNIVRKYLNPPSYIKSKSALKICQELNRLGITPTKKTIKEYRRNRNEIH
jgi:hypothetical protein